MSYASEAAAHDAEAHGHAHVPKPTYLTLILEDCLPIEKVKDIVASQVPELEPVSEETAKLGLGEGSVESTPRSKSDAMHGLDDKRKSSLGRFLHWRQKSHDTPRSHSIS